MSTIEGVIYPGGINNNEISLETLKELANQLIGKPMTFEGKEVGTIIATWIDDNHIVWRAQIQSSFLVGVKK
jgi:hypothetical protein